MKKTKSTTGGWRHGRNYDWARLKRRGAVVIIRAPSTATRTAATNYAARHGFSVEMRRTPKSLRVERMS